VSSSCAFLGGFAIGPRVSLLCEHSAEREMLASACTRSMPGLYYVYFAFGGRAAKHCDERVSMYVCLYTCLYVSPLTYLTISKTPRPDVVKFSVHVNCGHGSVSSDDNAISYVLPVLWMTTCLSIIGQATVTPTGRILAYTQ